MSEEKPLTPQEMRAEIESAPLIGDGPPIFDRAGGTGEGYNLCGLSLARAFLILCEENPDLLKVPSKAEDPSGMERAFNDKLWDAFKARWPAGSDWLGGPTGFHFGWAHNAVRYVLGKEAVGNPALLTIETEEA